MLCIFFFFKQKTAYEMRISDWSSDVCSSDLDRARSGDADHQGREPAKLGGHAAGEGDGPISGASERGFIRPPIAQIVAGDGDQVDWVGEIGRASCRERAGQYV